jgi:hypothetical protein
MWPLVLPRAQRPAPDRAPQPVQPPPSEPPAPEPLVPALMRQLSIGWDSLPPRAQRQLTHGGRLQGIGESPPLVPRSSLRRQNAFLAAPRGPSLPSSASGTPVVTSSQPLPFLGSSLRAGTAPSESPPAVSSPVDSSPGAPAPAASGSLFDTAARSPLFSTHFGDGTVESASNQSTAAPGLFARAEEAPHNDADGSAHGHSLTRTQGDGLIVDNHDVEPLAVVPPAVRILHLPFPPSLVAPPLLPQVSEISPLPVILPAGASARGSSAPASLWRDVSRTLFTRSMNDLLQLSGQRRLAGAVHDSPEALSDSATPAAA